MQTTIIDESPMAPHRKVQGYDGEHDDKHRECEEFEYVEVTSWSMK